LRTLGVLNVTVRADGDTEIEDKSAANVSNSRFDDIELGDWLEIRGAEERGGSVLATDIERDDEADDVMLGDIVRVVARDGDFADALEEADEISFEHD
jgi:hypothetical protein